MFNKRYKKIYPIAKIAEQKHLTVGSQTRLFIQRRSVLLSMPKAV